MREEEKERWLEHDEKYPPSQTIDDEDYCYKKEVKMAWLITQ